MNLSETQVNAMLELGGNAESHGFVPQRVLDELLSMDLIYWRSSSEVDFTQAGKEVYDELAGTSSKERTESKKPSDDIDRNWVTL